MLPVVYDCKAYCCVSGVSFHPESSLFYKCVTYVVLCIIVYNSYHWHISVMQKVHHLGSLCCVSSLFAFICVQQNILLYFNTGAVLRIVASILLQHAMQRTLAAGFGG